MWKFLGTLVSSFLLLRDFFCYLIPGLAFVALVSPVLFIPNPIASVIASPDWLPCIALVLAGYLSGHILAAIGYMVFDLIDKTAKARRAGPTKMQSAGPTVDWRPLYYRYLYPQLFTEADRRDTIHILRIALGVGLFLGCAVRLGFTFHEAVKDTLVWALWIVGIIVGLFMLINAHKGNKHLKAFGEATVDAAERARHENLPPFPWHG
jgi:hypothetical protein